MCACPVAFPTFVVCRELFFLYVSFHEDCGKLCCGEEWGVLNNLKLPLERSSWVREEREWLCLLQIIRLGTASGIPIETARQGLEK